MTLFLPLLVISMVLSGTMYWIVYGFPGLIHLTYHVLEFCQSLFVQCIEYYNVIKLIFLWLGAATLATGFAYGIIKGVIGIIKSSRTIKRLPLSKRCGSVVLIRDTGSKAAFTHGLVRPAIYISTGLLKSLDKNELKMVFLHELHHKRHHDPLRFFLFTFLKDSFFYIPAVRHLVSYLRFKKEHEADDAAVAFMKEPLSLAGALLKVAAFHKDVAMMPASITGGIEGGPITARIRRLVDGGEVRFKFPAARTIAASLFITAFLALSLALPLNASFPGSQECSTKHCALHKNKLGEDCRIHCKTATHAH